MKSNCLDHWRNSLISLWKMKDCEVPLKWRIGGVASATKSVFARVVINTVELYRQLYRQKHSVVQWTVSDSTGQCKDQIEPILEVDQTKSEVS